MLPFYLRRSWESRNPGKLLPAERWLYSGVMDSGLRRNDGFGQQALKQAGDIQAAGYRSHFLGSELLGPVEGVVDGGGHEVL